MGKYKSVYVTPETHKNLLEVKGRLIAGERRDFSMNETIEFLIDLFREEYNSEKPLGEGGTRI